MQFDFKTLFYIMCGAAAIILVLIILIIFNLEILIFGG